MPSGKPYLTFFGILISMKDFLSRNKVFLIVSLATVLIVGGGIFLMSKPTKQTTQPTVVDSSILVPQDSYKTSGFMDGQYLPASESAKVTLIEFGDYVCPACGQYSPYVKKILTDYAGKVNYVFRNYPLSYHTNAPLASYAALSAGLQGKYWEMHDKLYTEQAQWSEAGDARSIFISYADELGLNKDQFIADIDSQKVKDFVTRDKKDGDTVGLKATPTFFLNGRELSLGTFDELETNVTEAVNRLP